MRRHRWREVDIRNHERDDGAAVRHVGGAFGWAGLDPEGAPLTDPYGRERRFRTSGAAKVAVDRARP